MGAIGDSPVKAVTDQTFGQEVLESSLPVVVDFWAEWCGPCRMIAPALAELAKEFDGKVRFTKLDVDAEPETGSRFGIRAIPTLMLFSGGALKATMSGAAPKSDLRSWIEANLPAA